MIISLNNKLYEIEEKTLSDLVQSGTTIILDFYSKLDPSYRMIIKTFLRSWLYKVEEKAPDNLKSIIRPPKKGDPLEHLLQLALNYGVGLINDAELGFSTNDNDIFTDIYVKHPYLSETGGQLANSGS